EPIIANANMAGYKWVLWDKAMMAMPQINTAPIMVTPGRCSERTQPLLKAVKVAPIAGAAYSAPVAVAPWPNTTSPYSGNKTKRSEEHTSELQSRENI